MQLVIAGPESRRLPSYAMAGLLLVILGILVSLGQYIAALALSFFLFLVGLGWRRATTVLIALGVITASFSGIQIGPLTAPDLFLIPAAILLIPSYLATPRRLPAWLLGAGTCVFASGVLPLLFLDAPPRALIVVAQFAASMTFVPLAIALWSQSPSDTHFLAQCYVLTASVNAFFGVLDYFGITSIASQLTGFQGIVFNGGRVPGLSAHPNQLGLVCGIALPLALYLVQRNRVWIGPIAFLGLGVLVSGSRTGVLALVMAAAAFAWARGHMSLTTIAKVIVPVLLLLSVATALGAGTAIERLLGRGAGVDLANSARSLDLREGIEAVRQYPITGGGYSGTQHDLYLLLLAGGGLLGLAGFSWFAVGTLRVWTQRRLRDPLVAAAGASMITWLLAGLVHPGLYDRYLYIPAGILIAISLLDPKDTKHPHADSSSMVPSLTRGRARTGLSA